MAEETATDVTKYAIETWKKSIDVQQHFNEICMKVRSFYISLITALIALIGVIISRPTDAFFEIGCYKVHIGIPILFSIVVATYLFYFIDRHWYHRLLIGAVKNAMDIEKEFAKNIPGIGLTTRIGDNSPLDISKCTLRNFFLWVVALLTGADKRVRTERKIHSDAKISMFYFGVAHAFLVIIVIVVLLGGVAGTCRNLSEKGAENTSGGPAQTK